MRKILKSPRASHSARVTRSITTGLSLPIRSVIPAIPATPTPAPKKPASTQTITPAAKPNSYHEQISDYLEHSSAISTPAPFTGSSIATTPSDNLEYIDELERAMFRTGDEQTVNAYLINLLLPISWACGLLRAVHFDRRPFCVGPKENPLYQARVNSLLMIDDDIKGFMEVKAALRNNDITVQIQESAEMAAFIYEQGPKITSQKG